VESAQVDCDGDVLLFQVHAAGPACHTGAESCFHTPLDASIGFAQTDTGPGIVSELFQVVRQRQKEMPGGSYTTSLFESGTSRIAQKVAEEGSEVALAAATNDVANLPGEAADLIYHLLVLLADSGLTPDDVWAVLRQRRS
jgi:phosphoribosyl-ATP pyrophosphohydrolase/phosphoribosyl-AMP cyclohydrolase